MVYPVSFLMHFTTTFVHEKETGEHKLDSVQLIATKFLF